jgi:hypothetical protein
MDGDSGEVLVMPRERIIPTVREQDLGRGMERHIALLATAHDGK